MITYRRNPDWRTHESRCGTYTPCIICGRPVKAPRFWLHEHDGGGVIVTEEEAVALNKRDEEQRVSSDLGCWPIGPDCLRLHPELRPYVQVNERRG